MSKKPKDIKLGLLYLGRGEYARVIRLLESKIPLYLDNKEFYPILGKAFFYTGDYAGSKLYFDRGQKIHWDIESALYLAVLGLKRRDYNSALRIWLDILDEDPNNKLANKGLTTLKKYSTMDDLENFIHSKKLESLVPRKTIILSTSTIISIVILILLVVGTTLFIKMDYLDKIVNKMNNENLSLNVDRDGITDFNLNSLNNEYLDFSNQSIYSFSGAQIEEYFDIASKLFQEEKDNEVKRYLNLIKYSNANETIKNKAELLDGYLVEPNWTNYSDDISFKDIESNIFQYEGCIVKWKGKLSNLQIIDKKIHFSFLVGYDSGKVLEGVIPVELNENVKIEENQSIEVLGRVVLDNNSYYLEALTVRQYIMKNK